MYKTSLYLLIWIFSWQNGFAQKSGLIAKEKLSNDFNLFRNVLEESHPGIYRYTSKSEFDKAFSETEKQLDHDMTVSEFYTLTAPLIALLHCAHTKYLPGGAVENKYYYHTDKLFPLQLYFQSGKAFVIKSLDASQKRTPGEEVISINHLPVNTIINKLSNYITADGYGKSIVYQELNTFFNGYFSTFGMGDSSYLTELRDASGNVYSQKFNPVSIDKVDKSFTSPPEGPAHPYTLSYKGNAAILTIASFWMQDPAISFKKFLKAAFEDIRRHESNSLIIDVRNNEGGTDRLGSLLFSYIARKPFKYYRSLELSSNQKFSFEDRMYLPKPKWLLRWMIKERNGKFYWTKHKNLQLFKPQKNSFTGAVYILTNGRSMSVTSEFCAIAKSQQRAMFIGEETGGGFQGNNSGAFGIITLPNTNLTLGIPLVAYYMDVKFSPDNSGGVMPDFTITPGIHDILAGNDPVMNFALKQAAASK